MGLWIQPSYNRLAFLNDDILQVLHDNLGIKVEDYNYISYSNHTEDLDEIAKKYQIEIRIVNCNEDKNQVVMLIDINQSTKSMDIYENHIFDLPLYKEDETFISRTEEFLKEAQETYPFLKLLDFDDPRVTIIVSS